MTITKYIYFNLSYIFLVKYRCYRSVNFIKFILGQRLILSLFVNDRVNYSLMNHLTFPKYSNEYLLRHYSKPFLKNKLSKSFSSQKYLFDLPKLYNIKYQYYRIFRKYFNFLFLYFGLTNKTKPYKILRLIQRIIHFNIELLFRFNNLILYRLLLNTRLLFSYSAIITYTKLGLIYVNKYVQNDYKYVCSYGDFIEIAFNNKLLLIHHYFRMRLRKHYLNFRRKQRLFYDGVSTSTDKYRRFEYLTAFSKNFYFNTVYIKKFYEIDFQLQSCFILHITHFYMLSRDYLFFKCYISPTYL